MLTTCLYAGKKLSCRAAAWRATGAARKTMLGRSSPVVGDHHPVGHTDEERRDDIFAACVFRCCYCDDSRGRRTVHESGDEREVLETTGCQRLDGVDVIFADIGAHATIPPAFRALSA